MLTEFGLQSSRLDAPDTIATLLSASVNVVKPKLTAPAGLLSNGEGYPAYASCTWSIAPFGAASITLSFTEFSLEEDYDYVYVYDGLSMDDPLLAELTGGTVPPPVTSTGGSMLIVLMADGETHERGFEAAYRADNAPAGVVPSWQEGAGVCQEATYRDYVSFPCRLCVLATVSSVCGDNCITDHMHIVDRTKVSRLVRPAPCLPALSLRLAGEQGMRLGDALERSEPFGLSLASPQDPLNLTDLYLPMPQERLFGSPVYVGIDTGRYMLSCNPDESPDLWVITASLDQARSARCEGVLLVDLASGAAHSLVELSAAASVPFMIHTGLGECAGILSSVPPTSAGVLRLHTAVAACWLVRFFGPQSQNRMAPTSIELDLPGQRTLGLLSDLVLWGGQLSIAGGGATIHVGQRQIRVSPFAELFLDRVTVASSTASSAVLVEGRMVATDSSIRNCTARLNVLGPDGSDSQGGAAYVAPGGELVLHAVAVIDNAARGGRRSTAGGGIFASQSKVTAVDSTLQRNSASTAEGVCTGGAIALVDGSACELNSTQLTGNSVQGGKSAAGGALYAAGSSVRVLSGTINNNAAHGAAKSSSGGGLALTAGSSAELADTEVLQNVATDSMSVRGGAIEVQRHSTIKVKGSTIRGNSAERAGDEAYGGGLYLDFECSAELRNVEVLDNAARYSGADAYGGGLCAKHETTVAISHCVWRGNSASNADRYGSPVLASQLYQKSRLCGAAGLEVVR